MTTKPTASDTAGGTSRTKILTLEPSRGATISDRIRQIQPYELLIFFILIVLLALCLFVAQIVVEDVDDDAKQATAQSSGDQGGPYTVRDIGLDAAFVWGE